MSQTAKASDVALQLRKLAESLESEPDGLIPRPLVFFYADTKEDFLNCARLLPRPLTKHVESNLSSYPNLVVECSDRKDCGWISLRVPQSLTCTLVEPARPAVYDCPVIIDDAELTEVAK